MNVRQICAAALVLCVPLSAHAYVDPGSGMLIWQGLLAMIGAVLVAVRNPKEALKRLWQRIRRQ